jgi:hypothetical protein
MPHSCFADPCQRMRRQIVGAKVTCDIVVRPGHKRIDFDPPGGIGLKHRHGGRHGRGLLG